MVPQIDVPHEVVIPRAFIRAVGAKEGLHPRVGEAVPLEGIAVQETFATHGA